jgi:cytochrome oxidase Cu insertion factor (SCO1/SenC/PrrC family)
MVRLKLIFIALLLSLYSAGQKQRIITDNDKKFFYSDSSGVTQSYISYFGDSFTVPDLVTIDGKSITAADIKGKTIIYNFWFVACRPCVAEILSLRYCPKKSDAQLRVLTQSNFHHSIIQTSKL